MKIRIEKGDITKMETDAIVNAAKNSLLGGDGVDGAIHRAAGEELLRECQMLNGCETGQAKITKGYKLPAKYVIHTPGPVYEGGNKNEAMLLYNCYYNALALANQYQIESIAFPCISTGIYGYPFAEACNIALEAVKDFEEENKTIQEVVFVCFSESDYSRFSIAALGDI